MDRSVRWTSLLKTSPQLGGTLGVTRKSVRRSGFCEQVRGRIIPPGYRGDRVREPLGKEEDFKIHFVRGLHPNRVMANESIAPT